MKTVNELANEFIRGFKSKRIKPNHQTLVDLDFIEHQLYQEIERLAQPTGEDKILSGVNSNFDAIVRDIQLTLELLSIRCHLPFLYFTEIDEGLMPDDLKEGKASISPVKFIRQEFEFFITHCLKFTKADKKHHLYIVALIRQLISRPVGQRLMIELNQFARKHHDISISLSEMSTSWFSTEASQKKGDAKSYWSAQLTYSSNFYAFEPHNLCDLFNYGKIHYLALRIPFINFGHELIHVLNFFKGTHKLNTPIPVSYSDIVIPQFFPGRGGFEELWTIALADINENSLRAAHGLNPRFSHLSLALFIYGLPTNFLTQIRSYLEKTLSPAEYDDFYKDDKPTPTGKITITDFPQLSPSSSASFFGSDDPRHPLLKSAPPNNSFCCRCLIL